MKFKGFSLQTFNFSTHESSETYMYTPKMSEPKKVNNLTNSKSLLILIFGSVFALVSTFLLTFLEIEVSLKAAIFGGVLVLYLAVCAVVYFLREKPVEVPLETEASQEVGLNNVDVENRLFALEEANRFFGASLKPGDMFRLVASRVNELVPFAACAVFVADAEKEYLRVEFADGKNAALLRSVEIGSVEGNAGKTFFSGEAQFDEKLLLEKAAVSAEFLTDFTSAIAVPLVHGEDVFGVLQLYGDAEYNFDDSSFKLLEAISTRVAPLFVSSFAFERSLSNALTDALTDLPNERAFYLVLENQLAEAQRFRERRPLTILAIDIKDFSELNQKFGHASGDRLLKFAGEKIKGQLRQMDFLARSSNDEFLVILPTATEKTAQEIIARIERTFVTKPFIITNENKIFLQFNFGTAIFGEDGETAQQILQTANLRKTQSKSPEANNVLWFPKEFVN